MERILLIIGVILFGWFVLPKMSGFLGDIANIIKAIIRSIPALCGIIILIALIVFLLRQCPMLQ